MSMLVGQMGHAVLANQDGGGGEEGIEGYDALQPEERRLVKPFPP